MADNGKPSALDRAIQSAIGADRKLGKDDDPGRKKYPELWRWLSEVYCGRDHIKQPATLTIRLGPEGCLVTLTDRDLSVSFDVACGSIMDALQAMEAALTAPNPPIRNWGKKEPQLRKRRTGS